jgi:MoaA/NifB/PqqE/SkfB family radical SAM enzyme
MYNTVYFEISGLCNAKCPWCVNGRGNLKPYPSRAIPPEDFKKAIDYLSKEALIDSNSLINLYNYGEPLLHQRLSEILQILLEKKLRYTISTNASIFIELDPTVLKNLERFFISVPGFSQNSYDKIHGFDFKKILANIDRWINLIGPEKIQIQYHVYQFNLDEIETASAFFKHKGLNFFPYFAYFNDYQLSKSYLDHTLTQKMLDAASKELFLYYVDTQISRIPDNYICPQLSILTIDEYCNILTCCLISKADPDYSIGSLFSLSKHDIEQKKLNRRICKECMQKGISYWVNNMKRPFFIQKYDHLPS